jgi:hypothetical protein
LHDYPQRPSELMPGSDISNDTGTRWRPESAPHACMREVDDDATWFIQREQLLGRYARDIQCQLGRRPRRREAGLTELGAGCHRGAGACQQGGDDTDLKRLLYHEVLKMSYVVIYVPGGLFSTADNHVSPNADAPVTLIS